MMNIIFQKMYNIHLALLSSYLQNKHLKFITCSIFIIQARVFIIWKFYLTILYSFFILFLQNSIFRNINSVKLFYLKNCGSFFDFYKQFFIYFFCCCEIPYFIKILVLLFFSLQFYSRHRVLIIFRMEYLQPLSGQELHVCHFNVHKYPGF